MTGKIYCRFENGSEHLRAHGDAFMKQKTEYFDVFFDIETDTDEYEITTVRI